MSSNSEELSTIKKKDLAIQAGIEAIPYVEASISTLVCGRKQEMHIRRLEMFFKEIIPEIRGIRSRIAQMEKNDEETFQAIFWDLVERIECEQFMEKQDFFKIYFKNTLINPVNRSNYDERRFFLDVLGSISLLQIRILGILFRDVKWRNIGDIPTHGTDRNVVAAATIRLVYLGLAISQGASVSYNSIWMNYEQNEIRRDVN